MGLRDKIKPNLGAGMPPMISRQGNRFTLRDSTGVESKPTMELDIVICDGNANVSKMWRDDANFDPNNPTPPDCFSDNGQAPSVFALKPQNSACISCRWNERGSAVSKVKGTPIKACSDNQKLAVLVVDDPTHTLYQFVVTPGNLKAFRQYVNHLEGHKYEVEEVVTRVKFAPKEMGIILFEAIGTTEEAGLAQEIPALLSGGAARFVTGEDDQPRQAALPKPDAHEAIGFDRAQQRLGQDSRRIVEGDERQISSSPEEREEPRAGPTREQLEAQLAKMRETPKRGKSAAAEAVEEIPAFLNRNKGLPPTNATLGMETRPAAPPTEVAKLVQQHVGGQNGGSPALAERVTKAFGLPLRS